jgi:hypothetical protein
MEYGQPRRRPSRALKRLYSDKLVYRLTTDVNSTKGLCVPARKVRKVVNKGVTAAEEFSER